MNTNVVFFIPVGWSVVEHLPHPFIEPSKVELSCPSDGKSVIGFDLSAELSKQKVLNSNELDYLLAHPELIPEDWKSKYVCFWGTIYRYSSGHLCVRFLYWKDGMWVWSFCFLSGSFSSGSPAAVAT